MSLPAEKEMGLDGVEFWAITASRLSWTFLPCSRPQKVCLCPFFPPQPLEVSTSLYVVQHPAEVSYDIYFLTLKL